MLTSDKVLCRTTIGCVENEQKFASRVGYTSSLGYGNTDNDHGYPVGVANGQYEAI